jgi:hypothetical protein
MATRTQPTIRVAMDGPWSPWGRAFSTCACGATVLTHEFMSGDKETPATWKSLGGVFTPMGEPHTCEVAHAH